MTTWGEANADEWADANDPLPGWLQGGPFRMTRAHRTAAGWPERTVSCTEHPGWWFEGSPGATIAVAVQHAADAHPTIRT